MAERKCVATKNVHGLPLRYCDGSHSECPCPNSLGDSALCQYHFPIYAEPEAEGAAEEKPIEPEVWNFGDHWVAEIDYLAQGSTEQEARQRWHEGWSATVKARKEEGWYAPDGHAAYAAAFNKRFERDLRISRRVCETIERFGGMPHPHTTDEQYERLCDLLDECERKHAAPQPAPQTEQGRERAVEVYIPDVSFRDHGGQMCGAEFGDLEYANNDGEVQTYCEMLKGHAGAHVDSSMAGRIAWMTYDEGEAADTARRELKNAD